MSKSVDEGTATKSSTPSTLNASPTSPDANVAPCCNTPLLPPIMSFAFPFPGHQLTSPAGGGVQGSKTSSVGISQAKQGFQPPATYSFSAITPTSPRQLRPVGIGAAV